jgi:hypothetical protein
MLDKRREVSLRSSHPDLYKLIFDDTAWLNEETG